MIDDGPWAGVPIGGIGAGSIGRTQRGDFARWHLDVGRHRFESTAASSRCSSTTAARSAHVLSTVRPEASPAGFAFDLPVGAGPTTRCSRTPGTSSTGTSCRCGSSSASSARSCRTTTASRATRSGSSRRRSRTARRRRLTAGLMLSWQNVLGRGAGLDRGGGQRHETVSPRRLRRRPPRGAGGRRRDRAGRLVRTASCDGVELTATPLFAVDDAAALWADFDDGRLGPRVPGTAVAPTGRSVARSPRRSASSRASRGRSRSRLDVPLAEFAVGTRWHRRYTAFFGTSGRNAAEIAATALRERDAWSAAIDAGRRRSSPTRRDRTGTRARCSTSSTSWSTAGRSGPTARRCRPTAGSRRPARTRGRRPVRPVRPDRVLRLSLLQHARRRLLRVVRAAAAVAGAGAGGHPRVRRLGRRPRPGDRRDPVERQARDAQVPGRAAARRRRPRGRPVPASTPTATRTSTSGRTSTASSSSRSGATRRSSATTACCATRGRGS